LKVGDARIGGCHFDRRRGKTDRPRLRRLSADSSKSTAGQHLQEPKCDGRTTTKRKEIESPLKLKMRTQKYRFAERLYFFGA
jgi:hypothetical protein